MKKDERQQLHAQDYYIPLSSQGTQGHDVERPRLLIAEPTVPDQACGKAHRVGTVRVQGTLFALYRLHVAVQGRRNQVMLPHLFVYVDGCFVDHATWAATKTS